MAKIVWEEFAFDFDMICLYESYLDSSVSSHNDNLYIRGYMYMLVRADHPGKIKRGVLCVRSF